MIQYFYKLIFLKDLETNNEVFDLGLYSCKKNAIKKQEISKKLEGFRDYDLQHFKILKIGVNCLKKIQNKSGLKLFQLWHEYYNIQEDAVNYHRLKKSLRSKNVRYASANKRNTENPDVLSIFDVRCS